MTTTYCTTAAAAISRSISHFEIATAILDSDELTMLVALADEDCDTSKVINGHLDIWGTTVDEARDEWRVFVVEPTDAIDEALARCYDAACGQGYEGDADEWVATAEDIEWVVREVRGATAELVQARLNEWCRW